MTGSRRHDILGKKENNLSRIETLYRFENREADACRSRSDCCNNNRVTGCHMELSKREIIYLTIYASKYDIDFKK